MTENKFRLILASNSPRRQKMLEEVGLSFEIISPNIDENLFLNKSPHEYVKILSEKKVESVEGFVKSKWHDYIILGADTIVVVADKIYGKPADREEAFEMISTMAGKTHFVFTGFYIKSSSGAIYFECVKTTVEFGIFNKLEIQEYLDRSNFKDKAGAYGIQENGGSLIKKIDGSYTNVIGLPIYEVLTALKNFS